MDKETIIALLRKELPAYSNRNNENLERAAEKIVELINKIEKPVEKTTEVPEVETS